MCRQDAARASRRVQSETNGILLATVLAARWCGLAAGGTLAADLDVERRKVVELTVLLAAATEHPARRVGVWAGHAEAALPCSDVAALVVGAEESVLGGRHDGRHWGLFSFSDENKSILAG